MLCTLGTDRYWKGQGANEICLIESVQISMCHPSKGGGKTKITPVILARFEQHDLLFYLAIIESVCQDAERG